MTTSGSTSLLLTASDVIKTAYELLGVVQPEEDLTGDQIDTGLKHLNFMMKTWQSDGCNLWRDETATIVWPANCPDAITNVNYFDVVDVRILQAPGYQRVIGRWPRGDYNSLPNKLTPGDPTCYSAWRERGSLRLRLWPVPATDIILYMDIVRVIEDVTAKDQNLDLPQEWTECAYYCLADRLAKVSGVTDRVGNLAMAIKAQADELYIRMRDFDRPSSVFMRPSGTPSWGAMQ